MKTTGKVNGIISNIVIVKADGAVGQNEICYVYAGETKMMAEVIKVIGDDAYVQVFDSTRGLKIGDKVEFEGHMLEATLAPGMLSRNYDGLQNDLEKMDGLFIARGSITDPVVKVAKQAVMKSGNYAFIGRKQKKREFRQLWIARISAQAKVCGMNYSTLMHGLKKAGIELNRKMLAELAVSDKEAFAAIAEQAKAAL